MDKLLHRLSNKEPAGNIVLLLANIDDFDFNLGVLCKEIGSKMVFFEIELGEISLDSHIDSPLISLKVRIVAKQVPKPEELVPEKSGICISVFLHSILL